MGSVKSRHSRLSIHVYDDPLVLASVKIVFFLGKCHGHQLILRTELGLNFKNVHHRGGCHLRSQNNHEDLNRFRILEM